MARYFKYPQAAKCTKMHEKLSTDTQPLNYFNALSAVRDVLRENRDIYLVNEGATLDNARNIIDMYKPRRRLDCGTGCHGHRYGLCHRC